MARSLQATKLKNTPKRTVYVLSINEAPIGTIERPQLTRSTPSAPWYAAAYQSPWVDPNVDFKNFPVTVGKHFYDFDEAAAWLVENQKAVVENDNFMSDEELDAYIARHEVEQGYQNMVDEKLCGVAL